MSYSDLYFRSKRKPSAVLIVCAVLSVVGFLVFFASINTLPSRASKKVLRIHSVVNLASRQAGIYWQSDSPEVGWVLFGESPTSLNRTMLDERDVESLKHPSKLHYVVLKDLKESTTYYYKIVMNDELITSPTGEPFSFKTTQRTNTPTSLKPAYGRIIHANGEPVESAFVMLEYKNAYPLMALTKITGEWLIPLQNIVDRDTGQQESFNEKDTARITILSDDESTSINARISKINPVPQTLVLGRDYTFLEDSNVLPASTSVASDQKGFKVDILYPREGSIIPGNNPLIKGIGIPGKDVKITINTKPTYIYSSETKNDGTWAVGSTSAIPPGYYTLTMRTQDAQGKSVQLSRRFTIGKSGEQVLGDATPSATLTPSVTPSATPSGTVSPTATPTESPTPTPTEPIASGSATPTVPPPVSGLNSMPFLIGSAAFIIAGIGVLMAF